MAETNIYIISSNKSSYFEEDIFLAKKVKEINLKKLDVVFANSFQTLPILQKYCLKYNINTIRLNSYEPNDIFSIVLDYVKENPDKRTLASLIKEEKTMELGDLFKKNLYFNTFII